MLRSYFTVALRTLRRHLGYTLINVLGLAVGMACCLLIGLYVHEELSYDDFHEHADRLMMLGTESDFFDRSKSTPYPLAPVLAANMPGVEQAVRTYPVSQVPLISEGPSAKRAQAAPTHDVLLADPSFFEVFSFPLTQGDARTALDAPGSVVLAERTAHTLFGATDPIGRTLRVEIFGAMHEVTVQGIAQNPPKHSTIQFDLVAPLALLPTSRQSRDTWRSLGYQSYALLHEGITAENFTAKMRALLDDQIAGGPNFAHFAVPLTSVYLSNLHQTPGLKGQRRYVYIFGSVALFVLLIAAINYVNLVTAQSTRRAREVGVRKSIGAVRTQIAGQFLSESLLLSATALIIALGAAALVLPAFNTVFETDLSLFGHPVFVLGWAAFVLATGVGASVYPALVLSGFRPVRVLRGVDAHALGGGALHKGLVILQFAISTVLIIGTAIIYQQLQYIQAKNLGFDTEQVVVVDLPEKQTGQLRATVRQTVATLPGVVEATIASSAPGTFHMVLGLTAETISSKAEVDPKKTISFRPATVDSNYVETLGLRLVAGLGFAERPASGQRAYLINETAAQRLGWSPDEALGQPFEIGQGEAPGEVVGVVEDFHVVSLRQAIDPVALQMHDPASWSPARRLIARLAPGAVRPTMSQIQERLARYVPDATFEYAFLDDTFDAMYRSEQRLGQIFATFAALAIFVACLGLFGLAAYAANTRTKEIGIRKVLGASAVSIVALLSKDFLKLVGIAFIVAVPLAYYAMQQWLGGFAYRIYLEPGVFIVTGATALAIALLTVSYQALSAAFADPVQAIRHE